ncbi:MAG TPA: alpha/beta fold hydrolase [Crocinitomix sp.]|nr:alpha/beta fold hydrolase [Crocinitomix sp.]
MKLHYRVIGDETNNKPALFILHGLFGSSDNWQTLAKRFSANFTVYLVDQRNHGRSPHAIEHNYDVMVEDFAELIDDLGIDHFNLLGHSMGGKTAIGFAAEYPELLNKLIVVDISHKQYPMHHEQIVLGLKALDLSKLKTRGQADRALSAYIDNAAIRQFLLKNLYWERKGQLAWRINLPVLANDIQKIIEEVYFDTIEVPTLFVRGELSNYILESDFDEIYNKFPNSKIVTIKNAGHWVHAEQQEIFYQTIVDFLLSE